MNMKYTRQRYGSTMVPLTTIVSVKEQQQALTEQQGSTPTCCRLSHLVGFTRDHVSGPTDFRINIPDQCHNNMG